MCLLSGIYVNAPFSSFKLDFEIFLKMIHTQVIHAYSKKI